MINKFYIASKQHTPISTLATTWNNDSGFSNGYAAITSILLACLTYTGYDSAAHLAEETKNPSVQAPRSIIIAIVSTFFTGFVILYKMIKI
jgi:amino acid transporter